MPAVLFLAPGAVSSGDLSGFIVDFAFYGVFSAIISTALAKLMFASGNTMLANIALERISHVMDAPELTKTMDPRSPQSSRVEFRDVSFTYEGSTAPALSLVF